MSDLASALSVVAGQAFEKIGLEAKLGQVRRADRPDLADFQCNGAMAAAKAAKRNPREVAGEIAPTLWKSPPLISQFLWRYQLSDSQYLDCEHALLPTEQQILLQ